MAGPFFRSDGDGIMAGLSEYPLFDPQPQQSPRCSNQRVTGNGKGAGKTKAIKRIIAEGHCSGCKFAHR